MAKFKYSANVELKRGNVINGTKLNFVADENVFKGNYDIKELDKIALRFVKKQNKVKISEYEKVTVRGFTKLGISNSITNKTKNRTYKAKTYSKRKKRKGIFYLLVSLIVKINRIFK